ncbi:TolC family protein [Salmonirosea aquatica]|uniref:TolC family protein n=1 Tax=Salmonirosea aquatica TaxID=2654236 RepID=A0A7C9FCC3_9BACT|nr:TolC family protein [Cytophagaceae bacterium SJW1-29]
MYFFETLYHLLRHPLQRWLLAGTCLFCFPVSAQQVLGLEECAELLIKNNLTFRGGQLLAESAQAQWRQAKSQQLPTLGINVSQGVNLGRSIDRFTNAYIDQLYNSSYVGARVQETVFQGFQVQNQIRQYKLLKESSLESSTAVRNEQLLLMVQAYVQVLASKALYESAQQQVATSKEQVDRVEKQVKAGVVGANGLYEIRAQLSNDTFDEVTALNNYRLARLTLFQLLNIPPDPDTQFRPLSVKADEPVALAAGELFDEAEKNFPIIRAAELRRQSFGYLVKSIKALNYPSLNASADFGAFYASTNKQLDYFAQLNATRNGSLSLGLYIPIMGRWQTRPRVELAQVQERIARNDLDQSRLLLRQGIEQIVLDVTASQDRYQAAREQAEALEASYATVASRLNAGTATIFEYSLSKANLARAQANAIRATYEYIMNRKILQYYRQGSWDGIL